MNILKSIFSTIIYYVVVFAIVLWTAQAYPSEQFKLNIDFYTQVLAVCVSFVLFFRNIYLTSAVDKKNKYSLLLHGVGIVSLLLYMNYHGI